MYIFIYRPLGFSRPNPNLTASLQQTGCCSLLCSCCCSCCIPNSHMEIYQTLQFLLFSYGGINAYGYVMCLWNHTSYNTALQTYRETRINSDDNRDTITFYREVIQFNIIICYFII